MQPLLLVAIIGIAAVALGTGFLGNEMELWIQQFGVGSGDIQTPTDHVQVDFDIFQVQSTPPGTLLNLADCVLTLGEQIGQPIGSLVNPADPLGALVTKDSELTCKFTDELGNIIAESTIGTPLIDTDVPPDGIPDSPQGFFPAGEYTIPIGEDIRNIHDVIVVVHANTYNVGDFP